jgi:alpha-mannosidase
VKLARASDFEGTEMSSRGLGGTCYFLGHSHMDAAWLWPFSETMDVFPKTCESVLRLMEKYPDFCFCQSSAQYYEWLEKDHPETFERVKRKVTEGRWEIVGGTWVEPDGNIPSGESFVRQYVYGKRYFKEKFGVDVKVAWMPDSFGYAWTLPQIMKKSGMEFFLTQKMSWNDATVFPYFFFRWTGPDGSSIISHQTVGAYNETVAETRMLQQMSRLMTCQSLDDLLVLFGKGDHGGGVTDDMIERALEFIEDKRPPKGRFSTSKDYFNLLTAKTEEGEIPEIRDELYLQYHRGTYTTQAQTKKNNRMAEGLLETAEKLSTLARRFGCKYPGKELEDAWKKLLLNQFHDVLPGSSIPEVYEDSERDFRLVFDTANMIISESLKTIASKINTTGEGKSLLVFNPLSWPRSGIAEMPLDQLGDYTQIFDDEGRIIPHQILEKEKKILFRPDEVPSLGYREYRARRTGRKRRSPSRLSSSTTEKEIRLENTFLSVRVDRKTGHMKSIYDKGNKKEILRDNGNRIQIFEDLPVRGRVGIIFEGDAAVFDAWEVYIYQQPLGVKYVELNEPTEVKVIEKGPVRAKVSVKYVYSQEERPDSTFTEEVILYDEVPLLRFELHVDWHAEHRLAKVAFPLNVHSDFTTYEAPYGFITRRDPMSPEATLDERAKWEVPGQKWIDHTCVEGSYGVSLLNDSKYGFDTVNDVIRMTLLRSPRYPIEMRAHFGLPLDQARVGELTDQGEHHIAYALYPHRSDFKTALTARKAYEFNYPLLPLVEENHDGALPKAYSFVSVQPENIILTVVKKAEDSDDLVLRFYETSGKDTKAMINVDETVKGATRTDLMEKELSEIPTQKGSIEATIPRYGIETIKTLKP